MKSVRGDRTLTVDALRSLGLINARGLSLVLPLLRWLHLSLGNDFDDEGSHALAAALHAGSLPSLELLWTTGGFVVPPLAPALDPLPGQPPLDWAHEQAGAPHVGPPAYDLLVWLTDGVLMPYACLRMTYERRMHALLVKLLMAWEQAGLVAIREACEARNITFQGEDGPLPI